MRAVVESGVAPVTNIKTVVHETVNVDSFPVAESSAPLCHGLPGNLQGLTAEQQPCSVEQDFVLD